MNVKKRILESRNEWFRRVMGMAGIDFAITANDKDGQVIWHMHRAPGYGGKMELVGVKYGVPQIGHYQFGRDNQLVDTEVSFHSRTLSKTIGVNYAPDAGGIRDEMTMQSFQVNRLLRGEGIHFCTTATGEKWYTTNDSFEPDNYIRLQTAPDNENPHGKRGGLYPDIMDQMGVVFNVLNHRHEKRVRIDREFVTATVSNVSVPLSLAERYKVTEDLHGAVRVMKSGHEGVNEFKRYSLTLHLEDLATEGAVVDLSNLLERIAKMEFQNLAVQFDVGEISYRYDNKFLSLRELEDARPKTFYFGHPGKFNYQRYINTRGDFPQGPFVGGFQ